jgi:hypothetical protein
MYTAIPSCFPHFKSTVEVTFLNALSTACYSCWISDTVSKHRPFSFIFNLGNKAKSQGTKSGEVGRMGNDNHVVVSHKRCGFQGHVSRHIVMMKEPVVAPKFPSFSWHIFSQTSQNCRVKVLVDCSVRRNKFTVNNPLHVQKMNEHAVY